MAGSIFAAVFVVFFGLTFAAWRRYLWVAEQAQRRQEDTCPYSLTDVFDDQHFVNVQHQSGSGRGRSRPDRPDQAPGETWPRCCPPEAPPFEDAGWWVPLCDSGHPPDRNASAVLRLNGTPSPLGDGATDRRSKRTRLRVSTLRLCGDISWQARFSQPYLWSSSA